MTLALNGQGLHSGIAIGTAHILVRSELEIREFNIDLADLAAEIGRFRTALDRARAHLRKLAKKLRKSAGSSAEEIILTHLHMLDDAVIATATETRIADQLCNAEWALQAQLESIIAEFANLDDEYIRSREEDVIQVVRLIQHTLATETASVKQLVPRNLADSIVVAKNLAPNEVAQLHQRQVQGIVMEHGSPHAHSAILARSLKIPMVVGVAQAQRLLLEDESIIMDGHYGTVFATKDEQIQRHYRQKKHASKDFQTTLDTYRERDCVTRDGVAVSLQANAERSDDINLALAAGIDEIGLYRSEFQFVGDQVPDEKTQLADYQRAIELLAGRPLTVRTLDLGADKPIGRSLEKEAYTGPNPALGLRGIRLTLRNPELFKPQLKAILRAAFHGPVKILLPMVTSVQEIIDVKHYLDECRRELDAAGHAYGTDVPLGGMIEVPAAAMLVPELARELDFLSIGTNDLVQYLLAVDRSDEHVSHLYDPLHPAVLSLLRLIVEAADQAGLSLTLCGELAGDPYYTRLLLAIGLRKFSLSPANLLEVKKQIVETRLDHGQQLLDAYLKGDRDISPESLLNQLNQVLH